MTASSLVIAGAGNCGVSAAVKARASGFSGSIVLLNPGGHLPYERPPLSKWSVGEDAGDAPSLTQPIYPESHIAEAGIEVLDAALSKIDRDSRTVKLDDGKRLHYHRLLLATGATPRRLVLEGIDPRAIHHLRDLADATTLRAEAQRARHVVIIGGGFIGLELAASLRGCGVEVAVVEVAERLLSRAVPANIAQVVESLHLEADVTIHKNVSLADCTAKNDGFRVTLSDGTGLDADFLVAGIGSVPQTSLAEAAGLAIDNGIAVNAFMQSSDPAIFAAGDCCSYPSAHYGQIRLRHESWRVAAQQGEVAGHNMAVGDGEPMQAFDAVPWFWSDQYAHTLQISGIPVTGETSVTRHYADDHLVHFDLDANGSLVAAGGIGPGTIIAKDVRFAERLIAAGKPVDPAMLADPEISMKSLLKR